VFVELNAELKPAWYRGRVSTRHDSLRGLKVLADEICPERREARPAMWDSFAILRRMSLPPRGSRGYAAGR